MLHFHRALRLLGLLALAAAPLCAQPDSSVRAADTHGSTTTVVPGPEYAAGGLRRLFFGDLWRDLWTTEIEVEVLNMKTFGGGLKPTKRGGGNQTKSLRFAGADGREYKFRSLNKNPRKFLPADLQETVVGDIVQEFIATANPVSPVVAAPILDAAGVLNSSPRIVILPGDGLGEFRADFGGVLGMLEENPTADDEEIAFAGSDKVVTTYKLFKRLDEDNDEQVDARAFLRARLIDILMGDWDRHVDQWQWARFREGDRERWVPIPRDRDQAFCRYDGLVPWIAENAITQLEGCDDDYPKLEDLTWSGRYLDRRFLSPLDRRAWDSITEDVVARITDSVIRNAVRRMPAAMYAKEGAALEELIISRRDRLRAASREYYEGMAGFVEVWGSEKDEVAEIRRLDDGLMEVNLFKRDKTTGGKKGGPLFQRVFDGDETNEVRLFMQDGDDSTVVDGTVDRNPIIRVVGGKGRDAFVDRSVVNGYFLSVTPIPDAETSTYFHDDGGKSSFVESPTTCVDRGEYPEPKGDTARWEPTLREKGDDWRFGPWFNVTPDEGLFIGGGPILYKFGFRADPCVYRLDLRAGYATAANRFKIKFTGDFHTLVKGAHVGLEARASGLEVVNFFGLGNRTTIASFVDDETFYKVEQRQYAFHPSLDFPLSDRLRFGLGVEAKLTTTVVRENTYLAEVDLYGMKDMTTARLHAGLIYDSRNSTALPTSGLLLSAEGSYYPKTPDLAESFSRMKGEARAYLPFWSGTELALRAGGEKIWGGFPFFESAFIGGSPTMRAYERERFAGDASLFGNAELRIYLTKIHLIVPTLFGIFGAGDVGKVFLDGENSGLLDAPHGAYGGGIWLAPVERANTLSIAFMHSDEKDGLYLTGGFMF